MKLDWKRLNLQEELYIYERKYSQVATFLESFFLIISSHS